MNRFLLSILAAGAMMAATSCSEKESYADLLRDETHAVNSYLANYQVVNDVPTDTVFTTVNDLMADGLSYDDAMKLAPFYRIDSDGQLYMQVIDAGTDKSRRAEVDNLINFRFTRINLSFGYKFDDWTEEGNQTNMGSASASFRYKNFSLNSSYTWGEGIQAPLNYLPVPCEVRIIIKSALGPTEEVSAVYGYVYTIRYFFPKV